jgi:hypothetical protein
VNRDLPGDATQQPAMRARITTAHDDESHDSPGRSAPVVFVQRIADTCLRWSVIEVDAAAVPGTRGSHCLLFTREDCVRRVWDYPADWQSLDDAELAALSWHR